MLRGARRYTLNADSGTRKIELTAGYSSFGNSGQGASAPQTVTGTTPNVGATLQKGNQKQNIERYSQDILSGFVDYEVTSEIRRIQHDMYFFDAISGYVVDIRSKLPFSNFELSGTESKERRDKYTSSINAMQIRSMLPRIARERLVEGKHISYMNFDNADKKFTSLIPQNPEYCTLTPIPVYGRDPLVDVNFPDHVLKAIKSEDPDMKAELERYAEDLVQMVNEKKTRLDPRFMLYTARTPFAWSPYGISFLRRIIPIWLYEKALARGTIDMSGRRQKAIMHIMMGDDEWLPTNEQLTQITKLFIDADNDPVGAMVATRPGVSIDEVRAGGTEWKWDESFDTITTMKLRGLGVSEAIFGDLSVQAVENTLSTFMEDMLDEREDMEQRVFYNKMFPIIAEENDFKKSKEKILTASNIAQASLLEQYRYKNDYISRRSERITLGASDIDPSELDMPVIRWEKSLKIVSNDTLFNNLGTLAERGMPAPLRMQAALLGVSAEDMLKGLDQDIEDRKIIDEYQKKLPRPPAAEGEEGGEGGANLFMESSDNVHSRWNNLIGSNLGARARNRSFENLEQRDTKTGKILSRKGKDHVRNGENKIIMEAADRIRHRYGQEKPIANRKSYSYKRTK